jgi:putative acetyltransferase
MFLSIRPDMPADVPAIHAVTVAALLNSPHTDHTEQFIVDALRASGVLSISLVDEESGAVVGHVAVSPFFHFRRGFRLVWPWPNIREP